MLVEAAGGGRDARASECSLGFVLAARDLIGDQAGAKLGASAAARASRHDLALGHDRGVRHALTEIQHEGRERRAQIDAGTDGGGERLGDEPHGARAGPAHAVDDRGALPEVGVGRDAGEDPW